MLLPMIMITIMIPVMILSINRLSFYFEDVNMLLDYVSMVEKGVELKHNYACPAIFTL